MGAAAIIAGLVVAAPAVMAQDAPAPIRFAALSDPAIDSVQQLMIEQYKADNPGAEVTVEYIPGGADIATQYATQAASGSLADVLFTADLFVVPFSQQGITLDMQPLADADPDFDLSDIYENMLDLGRVGGEGLYMIPSSYDVVTMYYNKTMFEEAGAPLPEADWTWDDFIAACKTIKDATGNHCISMGSIGTAAWWAYYVPWITGYGGKILSDDGTTALLSSPESLAGLYAYVKLWTEHGIAQPLDFDAGGDCFQVGKCATRFFIPGFMSAMRAMDPAPFEWDVQVIPTLPQGKFTGMGTYGYAISANATNPEAAWDFVKQLVSPEVQLSITQNYAGMPLLKSLREDPAVTDLAGPPDNITAFIENGENGILPTYFPGECGSLYAGQINSEILTAMELAITGSMSTADAFTAANDNIQACLDG
jgi:multiple sugar transport system substrate-binding protein